MLTSLMQSLLSHRPKQWLPRLGVMPGALTIDRMIKKNVFIYTIPLNYFLFDRETDDFFMK